MKSDLDSTDFNIHEIGNIIEKKAETKNFYHPQSCPLIILFPKKLIVAHAVKKTAHYLRDTKI
jgi:hypothetical protein